MLPREQVLSSIKRKDVVEGTWNTLLNRWCPMMLKGDINLGVPILFKPLEPVWERVGEQVEILKSQVYSLFYHHIVDLVVSWLLRILSCLMLYLYEELERIHVILHRVCANANESCHICFHSTVVAVRIEYEVVIEKLDLVGTVFVL